MAVKYRACMYNLGYVFLVFENESSVRRLVDECHTEEDKYYLFVSSPTMKKKPVQMIVISTVML